MKTASRRKKKSFLDLSPAERDREVARFDREVDVDKETRPMTLKERVLFERMRGRSVYVLEDARKGRTAVLLELDDRVLDGLDAFARSRKLTRTEAVERTIRTLLSLVQEPKRTKEMRRSA